MYSNLRLSQLIIEIYIQLETRLKKSKNITVNQASIHHLIVGTKSKNKSVLE